MPKEIANKIKVMESDFLSYPDNLNIDDFGKVGFPSMKKDAQWGLQNNKKITLQDFVKGWIEIIEIIEAWIKANSDNDKTLNI